MEALDRLRRGRGDLLAGGGVAGQRDHVDVGMGDQSMADRLARPGDDVENALREDVGGQLSEAQGRHRRRRRRLEHDRAARGERRAELPDGHHQRVVPRRDLAHDARRLAPNHARVGGGVLAGRLAFDHPRGAGEEAHVVDRELDVEVGHRLGLADVLLLEQGKCLGVVLDGVGELVQRLGAVLWRGQRPLLERPPRGDNSAIDIGRVSDGDLGDRFLGCRIDDAGAVTGAPLGPVAVDEHASRRSDHSHGRTSPCTSLSALS